MTGIEKWEKLFPVNQNDQAHFLFDKYGLPIKIKDIEQPVSIQNECSKR
jgi:hypothetical protein